MAATMTPVEELLARTETTLGLTFRTDEPATESITDTDTGTAVIAFAPVRMAGTTPLDAAATKVADLWRSQGYSVTRTDTLTDIGPGAILDAHNDRGDILACHLSPYCTILSGECAPQPR